MQQLQPVVAKEATRGHLSVNRTNRRRPYRDRGEELQEAERQPAQDAARKSGVCQIRWLR